MAWDGGVFHAHRLHRHHQFVLLRDNTQGHEQNQFIRANTQQAEEQVSFIVECRNNAQF